MSVLTGVQLPERYEPIRRIASGGMASVWCARDRTLDRHVAIKMLAEPFAHDELSGRRFKREARAAARLSGHSNVVTIYDVGQAEDETPLGRPFIVMEYLPGGTVSAALRAGEADPATVVSWLYEAAGALDYAHGRGVIHRDVKLANFLLDRDRVLHVADFGIAQLGPEDSLTVGGQVLGTAAYLAPERALGHPATEASDRYSLAVAAFELLVGERPFTAEHFAAQARQHVEDPPPRASRLNARLPAALDGVLARGMAKQPIERFTSAHELAEAVDHALAGRPAMRAVPATPPTRITAALPRATAASSGGRGRTAAFAALAAAAVGVGIAAAASGTGSSGPPRPAAQVRALGHTLAAQRPASPPAPTAASKPKTSTATTPAATTQAPTTSTATAPPAAPPDALEAQGHQLMIGGDYNTAIPVLRRAVASAPPASLTYAYALYDLGRSLRLAGNPRAAVPILWRRLQIPNQTGVVRTELARALRALGQQSGGAPPGSNPPGRHGHHGGSPGAPSASGASD